MFCYNNQIVQKDLKQMSKLTLQWHNFTNKTILVTGANSMLGTYMAYLFLYLKEKSNLNIKTVVLTRSIEKTKELFYDFLDKSYFEIIHQDITAPIKYIGKIDYIFHFAGNASPRYINSDPVGILQANLLGMFNVMEFSRDKEPQRIIFASTREVYGAVEGDSLSEESFGILNPMENRSCYPESKRAAESIMRSYFLQHGINGISVRIAHCYGPGMKIENDGRIMSDLIGDAVHDRNIVLKSSGEAIRSFCYLTDAIIGMIQIVLYGKVGEAYNLANETEPVSIKELANMISKINSQEIKYDTKQSQAGYCNYTRVELNTSKLQNLGFKPEVKLIDGIKRTILSFK